MSIWRSHPRVSDPVGLRWASELHVAEWAASEWLMTLPDPALPQGVEERWVGAPGMQDFAFTGRG